MTEAAARLGCTRQALSRLLNGKAGISAAMAIALERMGWSNASFWMRLQAALRTCPGTALDRRLDYQTRLAVMAGEPCMEVRLRRRGQCRHFLTRQRSRKLPRLRAP